MVLLATCRDCPHNDTRTKKHQLRSRLCFLLCSPPRGNLPVPRSGSVRVKFSIISSFLRTARAQLRGLSGSKNRCFSKRTFISCITHQIAMKYYAGTHKTLVIRLRDLDTSVSRFLPYLFFQGFMRPCVSVVRSIFI